VSQIGVYESTTRSSSLPDYYVARYEARRRIQHQWADAIARGKAIRMRPDVEPSSSRRTPSALTSGDTEALAERSMSARQRERIAGWDLARRGQL
jgi:hypothetical protein